MGEVLFTPAAILDLLSKIDELSEYDLNIVESLDGNIQLQIGDSVYELSTDNAADIQVTEDIVEEVSDINVETYQSLESDDIQVNISEEGQTIESGILKELAKTLLLGGMIRLSKKLLK